MRAVLREDPAVQRLVGGWLLLALLALTLSTACAVLLISARMPLPGALSAIQYLFRSALVLHVGLAVIVWFLCCAAALWTLAAKSAGRLGWISLMLACVGVATMMAGVFSGSPVPVLANYIPVLDSPVFLLGLAWFLAGIGLTGGACFWSLCSSLRLGKAQPWRLAALLSIGATLTALLALAASVAVLGVPAEPARFELLSWGPGHVLQFGHVLLLMAVWSVLAEDALGKPVASRTFLNGLLMLAALPVVAVPVIYALYSIDSFEFRQAFTRLMAWSSWPACAILGFRVVQQLVKTRRWKASGSVALLLSISLFFLGCLFGALIRGESTMVPAHYHGTVGAVTLAYMALGYRLLPGFGLAPGGGRLLRWQPVLYGTGLVMLAAALAWSGWLGVPRKSLHVDTLMQFPAYFVAMGLIGIGGALAVSGAALFIFNIIHVLRAAGMPPVCRSLKSAALTSRPALWWGAAILLASGALLSALPDIVGMWGMRAVMAAKDPAGHVKQRRKEEIARQFAEGVSRLNAREYEAAASALHRVLELAPQMPEAHVNMGFAMIGLQKYAMARDFFDVAISLRANQLNAYYGLGIALEGLGDVAGALGAMRTYVHRSKGDDPYLRKANAAIWEWESQLERLREKKSGMSAKFPGSGNDALRYPIAEKKLR